MSVQEGEEARRKFVEAAEVARQSEAHDAADLLGLCAELGRALQGDVPQARAGLVHLAESVSCPWLSSHAALWSSALGSPWSQAAGRADVFLSRGDGVQRPHAWDALAYQALEQAVARGDQLHAQRWTERVRTRSKGASPVPRLLRMMTHAHQDGWVDDIGGWVQEDRQATSLWDEVEAAEGAVRRGALDEGRQRLVRVMAHAEEESNTAVTHATAWLLGVTQLLRSQPEDALHRLERARRGYDERLDLLRSMMCSALILVGEAWSGRLDAAAGRSMEVRTPKGAPRLQETARLAEHIFNALQAGGRIASAQEVPLAGPERGPLEHLVLERIAERIESG